MKKLVVILSCVLLLAALTLTPVFANAGSAELAASATAVQFGKTVTVTLSVSGFGTQTQFIVNDFVDPEGMQLQDNVEWLVSSSDPMDINLANREAMYFNRNGIDLSKKTDLIRFTYKVSDTLVGDLNKTISMNFLCNKQMMPVTVNVTVYQPATGLTLNQQTLDLDLSGTKTAKLTATPTPADTTETVSWTSSNKAVATVDNSGNVTAVAEGNATITATIGSVSKTCNVTVSCGHAQKTEHAAATPTCQKTGNNKYYTCDTCQDVFKADGTTATTVAAETLATVKCSGGTATCSQQATCQWCAQPYGDTLPHKFTQKLEDAAHFVAGSGANCQQVKQYYYDCADCTAISTSDKWESSTYGAHDMDAGWTTANGKHYHKCKVSGCTHKEAEASCAGGTATCQKRAVCGTCSKEYGELAKHSYTAQKAEAAYLKTAATCKDLAVYVKCCSMCDLKDTDLSNTFTSGAVNPKNHVGGTELKDAKTETCGDKGYTGDTWCLGCNTKTATGTEIPATGNHTGGTATCTSKAVCGVCGQNYGATKPHAYSAEWTSTGTADTDKHYQLCTTCNTAKQKEDTHSFITVTDTPATEDATGIAHEECSVCKVKRNENTVLDKLPHVHRGIVRTAAKAATCVATGNVEYWTCADHKCAGKYYGDAACKSQLTDIVTAIDPANHAGTELRGAIANNCYQDGYSGDTYCVGGCGAKVKTGSVLPATGNHKAGTQWFNEGDKHWQTCTTTGCTAKVGEATHTYQWKLDKAATEDATGLKHEECVCGVKRNENTVIDKLDHVHKNIKHFDAVKATCVKAGTLEYWTCADHKCAGKYYGDAKCQLELSAITEAINKNNHVGGTTLKDKVEATCSKTGYSGDTYCNSCKQLVKKGAVVAPTGKHTPSKNYLNDEKQHWKVCAVCGDINGYRKEAHTYTWIIDKKATEAETGLKHQKCTACGYITAKNTVIDKLPHSPVRVDGKACTCTEDGVLEHFLCANCGRYYASVNGQPGDEITKEGTVLKATGHAFGTEWKTDEKEHWHVCACGAIAEKAAHTTELVGVKEATEEETGYSGDEICTVCDYQVATGEVIPVITKSIAPIVIAISAAAVVVIGGIFLIIFKKRKHA